MRHLFLCAVLLLALGTCGAGVAEYEPILSDSLRSGWSVRASRGLSVALRADTLEVRPDYRTRSFAAAELVAAPAAAVDGRACTYLAFEINTLAGSSGQHSVPLLRVGVSNASTRSRQPLLSRYLQLDTDPTSWQQVLVPLEHALERGVSAAEIAYIGWQLAGPATPFAVRAVALVAGPTPGETRGDGQGNLLPDPSFETRRDARPVWATVGDYRDLDQPGDRSIVRGPAAHGNLFLRLNGPHAYFFEALAPVADAAGFAVALRANSERAKADASSAKTGATPQSAARAVEIGCEIVSFGTQGGVRVIGRAVNQVPLESGWRRHAVSAVVHPGQIHSAEAGLRLYRAWVRPLGKDAAAEVDAAYLANTPVEASTFYEGRANPVVAGLGIFRQVRPLLSYRPLTAEYDTAYPPGFQADLPPVRLPLEVREWAGRDWPAAIVAGGIPVARGRIYSPDALCLRGPDGRELPFQFEVLRRDPRDGSVRCLWLAFTAPLRANQRVTYTLESGATTALQAAPIAAEEENAIILNTGERIWRIPRDRFTLLGEEDGLRLELLDGRVLTSLGMPTRVAVERNGSVSAVVSVRGFLAPEDARQPAPRFLYDVRLRAWKDTPGLQVDVAVTNLTPELPVPVRSLALVAAPGRGRRVSAALGIEGGAPLAATVRSEQVLRVTQRREAFGPGREELYLEAPGESPRLLPGRVAGWATWRRGNNPPMALGFSRMADRHPAALEVSTNGLAAYLIPPSGIGAVAFPLGLSAYGEFWLGSGEDPTEGMARLQRPALLRADPAYVATTGVFRPFVLPEQTQRRFPLLNWVLQRETALWQEDRERTGETGWLNDGDTGSFGLWRHGGADGVESLILQYLRTGDPRLWDRARRQLLHVREVCAWRSNESSAFYSTAAAGLHTHYGLDPGHIGTTGILQDYWLTGDRRSLETADALGAELLSRAGYARYPGRERGSVLFHLAELYAATGRRVYREAFLRNLARPITPEGEDRYGGMALSALAEGLDLLEESGLEARFRSELDALASRLQRERPLPSLGPPAEGFLYRALSYVAPDRLPLPAREASLEHILWHFLAPYSRDVSLPRATQALATLPPGVSLPAWANGVMLGIGPYSGSERRFTLRIQRRGNEPVRLTLCRLRGYPPDILRNYPLRASLRDPLGKRVEEIVVDGEGFQTHTLALPGVGITGDYFLQVRCEEDALAEVVTAHPRITLRADEWHAARYAQAQGRFFLRAPTDGAVRIATRGEASPTGDSLVAAVLRAPDGTIISQARWSVPLAGTDADGRPATRAFPEEDLSLPVPAAHRNQILCLEITSARGVQWRVEGLDEPWLGATPEAFAP